MKAKPASETEQPPRLPPLSEIAPNIIPNAEDYARIVQRFDQLRKQRRHPIDQCLAVAISEAGFDLLETGWASDARRWQLDALVDAWMRKHHPPRRGGTPTTNPGGTKP